VNADAHSSGRKHVRILVVILAVALVLRLAALVALYSIEPGRVLAGDSPSYENPARALVQVGRFAASPETPDVPETLRTPGYPAFIAAVYLVFGERHFPVIALQVIVSVATIWIASAVARRLWGPGPALVAALLLTFDVMSFASSQKLLSDTLFTFLVVIAVAAGVRMLSDERARSWWALLLGGALALATLVRPISYYLVLPLVIGLLAWGVCSKMKWTRVIVVALVVVAPSVVLVGGWQVRNYCVSGSSDLSHIRGHNLLWCRGTGIVALRDGISLDEARERIRESLPSMEGWSDAEKSELYAREGSALMRRHPVLYVRMAVRETPDVLVAPAQVLLVRYLTGEELYASPFGDVFRLAPGAYVRKWVVGRPLLFAAFGYEMAYLLVLYICVLYGVWRLVRGGSEHRAAHVLVCGVIVYFIVLSAGPEADPRFRVPFMPLLAVYAGWGLSTLVARFRARRSEPADEHTPASE